MEVDSPGNKRKNDYQDDDEIHESPTKQTKNHHNPHHNNVHHNQGHNEHHNNNNNNNHGHHKQEYYNSEDEGQQDDANQYTTQNNNMDDYVGGNDNKVTFVYKPEKKKKSTFIDYRPGPAQKGLIPVPKGNKNCLAGKVFLITGILDSLDRDEAAQLIECYKGKVVTGVTQSLTHAVVGKLPGPKKQEELNKLQEAGKIEILNQAQLFSMISRLPAISDDDAKELGSPKKKPASPKKSPKSPSKGKGKNNGQDKTPPKDNNNDKDNKKDNKKDAKDDDNEKRKSKKDKGAQRDACMYGETCYRKNPQHRQEFAHPGDPDYNP